ncbi:MAG: NUDIX hydrolase [Campylobacterales bacterium]|nr:NUDIX hydrolase [Campylobacterales bacterium]
MKRPHSKIENFSLRPLEDARYVKTALATYHQDGIPKQWEVVQAHDSVAVLIYHEERDAFILVKQFRPAVFINNNHGVSIELCAGIVDKAMSLEQIAKEEIEEECGFAVPLEKIERVTSFYTSVGFAGSKQTLYVARVNEVMRVSAGGGVEGELIEVIELPLKEAEEMMYDETITKTPGLLFAFMWWFAQNQT